VATDLRVLLTDKCNLRCTYCMPAGGLPWLPRPDLLTDDKVVRLGEVRSIGFHSKCLIQKFALFKQPRSGCCGRHLHRPLAQTLRACAR
jgi:hypothetical protein